MRDTIEFNIPYNDIELEENPLGEGAFGVVYKGKWHNATVAVKQLKINGLTNDDRQQFEQETKIMSKLHHPNVLHLFGISMDKTPFRMVMEYMNKGSLDRVLAKEPNMPWPTRIRIAIDIGSGLSYLHGESIIHRDLKSLNILLTPSDTAKIADFGLSKVKETTASLTGNMGSVLWMAPELFDEGHNNKASDVYSYGVVLWEISSNKLPWEGLTPAKVMSRVMQGKLEPIPPETPEGMKQIIDECRSLEPKNRPTARYISERLEQLKQPTPAEPLQPPAQPNPPAAVNAYGTQNFALFGQAADPTKDTEANVNAYAGGLNNPGFKDPILASQPNQNRLFPTPLTDHKQATQRSNAIQDQVDPQNVQAILKSGADAHLDNVRKLLEKNRKLASAQGDVTDPSGRIFKKITVLQYALWALDFEMIHLILKYIDKDEALEQLNALENREDIKQQFGSHFSFDYIIEQYVTYDEKYSSWTWEQVEHQWQKQIGGAQRMLPAWVVYFISESGKNTAWTKQNVNQHSVNREYSKKHLELWWNHKYEGSNVGLNWAWLRGTNQNISPRSRLFHITSRMWLGSKGAHRIDRNNFQTCRTNTTEQLISLRQNLSTHLTKIVI